METNGSPPAIFETDEESHYFLTVLPIHLEAGIRAMAAIPNTPVGEQTHPYTGVFPIGTPNNV